jgi:tetratricopeptide (TPR) repeat protein
MISMCDRIADYRRAGEWGERASRWCEPHSDSALPGICSVHRAEVMRVRGDWDGAESEAERASARHADDLAVVAAEAFYVTGEIKLRRGDHAMAEAAFREAHQRGRQPFPGLALLRVAQGKLDTARSLIDRALTATALDIDRIRLLPAAVEIAIATGDFASARVRANELEALAAKLDSTVFAGHAALATGAVELATGEREAALDSLLRARRHWHAAEAPYDEARTGLLMALAYRDAGEVDLAELEVRAARATFERLGAVADLARCDALLAGEA